MSLYACYFGPMLTLPVTLHVWSSGTVGDFVWETSWGLPEGRGGWVTRGRGAGEGREEKRCIYKYQGTNSLIATEGSSRDGDFRCDGIPDLWREGERERGRGARMSQGSAKRISVALEISSCLAQDSMAGLHGTAALMLIPVTS